MQYTIQGNKVLEQKIGREFPEELREEIEELLDEAAEAAGSNAVAIAANQLKSVVEFCEEATEGVLPRAYIDLHHSREIYWNPTVLACIGSPIISFEGCLSVPDSYYAVNRSSSVIIQYEEADTSVRQKVLKDFEAVIAQHEIDHLDGILISLHGMELEGKKKR